MEREPTQAKMERTQRRLAIRDLIKAEPEKWTVTRLQREFGVGRGTIERDIEKLKSWGEPIYPSPKGYFIGRNDAEK